MVSRQYCGEGLSRLRSSSQSITTSGLRSGGRQISIRKQPRGRSRAVAASAREHNEAAKTPKTPCVRPILPHSVPARNHQIHGQEAFARTAAALTRLDKSDARLLALQQVAEQEVAAHADDYSDPAALPRLPTTVSPSTTSTAQIQSRFYIQDSRCRSAGTLKPQRNQHHTMPTHVSSGLQNAALAGGSDQRDRRDSQPRDAGPCPPVDAASAIAPGGRVLTQNATNRPECKSGVQSMDSPTTTSTTRNRGNARARDTAPAGDSLGGMRSPLQLGSMAPQWRRALPVRPLPSSVRVSVLLRTGGGEGEGEGGVRGQGEEGDWSSGASCRVVRVRGGDPEPESFPVQSPVDRSQGSYHHLDRGAKQVPLPQYPLDGSLGRLPSPDTDARSWGRPMIPSRNPVLWVESTGLSALERLAESTPPPGLGASNGTQWHWKGSEASFMHGPGRTQARSQTTGAHGLLSARTTQGHLGLGVDAGSACSPAHGMGPPKLGDNTGHRVHVVAGHLPPPAPPESPLLSITRNSNSCRLSLRSDLSSASARDGTSRMSLKGGNGRHGHGHGWASVTTPLRPRGKPRADTDRDLAKMKTKMKVPAGEVYDGRRKASRGMGRDSAVGRDGRGHRFLLLMRGRLPVDVRDDPESKYKLLASSWRDGDGKLALA